MITGERICLIVLGMAVVGIVVAGLQAVEDFRLAGCADDRRHLAHAELHRDAASGRKLFELLLSSQVPLIWRPIC